MPAFLSWLGAFASVAFLKPLIARILILLGITAVTYAGVSALWDSVTDSIFSNYGSTSSMVLAYLSMAKIPQAISVIISAYSTRLTMAGLTAAGGLRRIFWDGRNSVILNP